MRKVWREWSLKGSTHPTFLDGQTAEVINGNTNSFKSASVVVTGKNGKRSVKMGLLDGERIGIAGNVTIPPGEIIPEEDQIIEVRYLYAFPESGALFQPVYLGERDDITKRGMHSGSAQIQSRGVRSK